MSRSFPLLLCVALGLASVAHADPPATQSPDVREIQREEGNETHFAMGLGAEYSEGDFGLDEESRFAASTLRFRVSHGPWIARLSVPYQYTSGGGDVVGPADAPVPICDSNDNSGPGNAEDRCAAAAASGTRSHAHGIGDVTLALLYTIDPPREWLPYVELGAKVKFGTADEDMGTGRNDYTLGIELDQTYGRVTPFVGFGYRFVGDPTGVDLHDIWLASAGASYDVSDTFTIGLAYDYREHSADGADDSHEIGPFASWKLSSHWRLGAYADAGLSDGAPDWSAGTSVTYTFR